jgi:GNAT superfamily N-acetyltransferase
VTLPKGFTTRALTVDDLDAVFHLIVACEAAATGVADIDPEDIRSDWARPGFDLAADAVAVCEAERIVATAEVFKNRADVNVHPASEGLGLGAWLLRWTEDRSRSLGRTRVGQTLADTARDAVELLQCNGYGYGHTSWMLAIEMDGRPDEPELPDGVSIRTFVEGVDDEATYRVVEDAFNEWPNREPASFDEWAALTIRREDFEPALLQLAIDGERVVGVAFSIDYPGSEGWVQQVAVAATHRHRGIARALLQRAFAIAWDRGDRACGLSTDSRTGALGLYEKVGMKVIRSYTNYVKELQLEG